ncbi:cation ABC transporter ATP-binding protein, partial [Pseudomonas syringae pv. actinidiae ICMP 19079]
QVTGLNRRVLFDEPAATALTPERLLTLFSAHPRNDGSTR